MTDYTGTEAGCKGMMLTGCRNGQHGWGCPLADPLEDIRRTAEERVAKGFEVPAGLLGSSVPKVEISGTWSHDPTAPVSGAIPESMAAGVPKIEVTMSGRRSGKTRRMEVTKGIFILADLDKTAVDVPWATSGGLMWVCPVCASGETWWTVQLVDSLQMPPMVEQEALVRDAAITHMAQAGADHEEWILDYLEMAETDGEDA